MSAYLVLAMAFLSSPALADSGEDPRPVADHKATWDYASPVPLHLPVSTNYSWGAIATHASVHIFQGETIEGFLRHEMPPGMTGLPYNFFRVEIRLGEGPDLFVHTIDLTSGCQSHGVSLYTGSHYRLPSLTIPPRSDGRPRTKEPVRVRVWGHL